MMIWYFWVFLYTPSQVFHVFFAIPLIFGLPYEYISQTEIQQLSYDWEDFLLDDRFSTLSSSSSFLSSYKWSNLLILMCHFALLAAYSAHSPKTFMNSWKVIGHILLNLNFHRPVGIVMERQFFTSSSDIRNIWYFIFFSARR